jgi:hypothetical protein
MGGNFNLVGGFQAYLALNPPCGRNKAKRFGIHKISGRKYQIFVSQIHSCFGMNNNYYSVERN